MCSKSPHDWDIRRAQQLTSVCAFPRVWSSLGKSFAMSGVRTGSRLSRCSQLRTGSPEPRPLSSWPHRPKPTYSLRGTCQCDTTEICFCRSRGSRNETRTQLRFRNLRKCGARAQRNTSPAGMRFCHEDLVVEQQEWCDILTGFRFG
jgi:hypothetical protein